MKILTNNLQLLAAICLTIGLTFVLFFNAASADRVEIASEPSIGEQLEPTSLCNEVRYEPAFGVKLQGEHMGAKLRQAAHLRCWRCCDKAHMKYSYMAEGLVLVCHCTNEF